MRTVLDGFEPAKVVDEPVLTKREEQVAERVAKGRTNDEVAAELGLGVKTVETHLTRIYRKLGLRSRTELAARRRDSP